MKTKKEIKRLRKKLKRLKMRVADLEVACFLSNQQPDFYLRRDAPPAEKEQAANRARQEEMRAYIAEAETAPCTGDISNSLWPEWLTNLAAQVETSPCTGDISNSLWPECLRSPQEEEA